MRIQQMESAGGLVYRNNGGLVEVVLCGRDSPKLWALPKGTPEYGESREQTAVREVTEETGLKVNPEGLIGKVEYCFVQGRNGVLFQKTVYFYLMTSTGGDISLHDSEFDEVRWFHHYQAITIMTYGNETNIVEKGLSMVPR